MIQLPLLAVLTFLSQTTYQNGTIGLKIDLPTEAVVIATNNTPPFCMISSGNPRNVWHLRLERGIHPAVKTPEKLLILSAQPGDSYVLLENTPLSAGELDGWWRVEKSGSDGDVTIIGKLALPTQGEQFILASFMTDEEGWARNSGFFKQIAQTIVPLDPLELISKKLAGLDAANARLNALNKESLQELIGFSEWRRIRSKTENGLPGTDIGYARIYIDSGNIEEVEYRKSQQVLEDNGIIVTLRTRIVPNVATGVVTDSYARYWMSWDSKEERWSNRVTRWLDKASATESETGIRNRPEIGSPKSRLMVLQQDLTSDVIQTPFKALAEDPWLPRALVWVLGPLMKSESDGSDYIWMTYENSGDNQRVVTRTDSIKKNENTWTIETHFGENEITLRSTFDEHGHLVIQEQKNGGVVTSTTEEELRAIWGPRNLW
jgi:hypothetical protein